MKENKDPNFLKKNWLSLLAVVVAFISLADADNKVPADNNSIQLINLESKITDLDSKISSVETQLFTLRLENSPNAVLSTTTKDYDIINNKLGKFFVSVQDIKKYANGYKIILNIGNPNSVTYLDAKAILKYGPPYDNKKTFEEWQNSQKSIESAITKPLVPGTWNKVELIAAPAKEEDLGNMYLGLEISRVSLNQDYRY